MTEEEVASIALTELESPTLGVTEQYLEVHQPVKENGIVQVERVDLDGTDNFGIVYIPVHDERFHFAIYVNLEAAEVQGFGTESWNRVYFRATSEQLSSKELESFTTLTPTETWNKGDLRPSGKAQYRFSSVKLEPNPEPDEFEDKLTKLLNILEQDQDGITKLTKEADAGISVAMDFHDANSMLGGMYLNLEHIKLLNNLNLSIDFDLYTGGNKFKEDGEE